MMTVMNDEESRIIVMLTTQGVSQVNISKSALMDLSKIRYFLNPFYRMQKWKSNHSWGKRHKSRLRALVRRANGKYCARYRRLLRVYTKFKLRALRHHKPSSRPRLSTVHRKGRRFKEVRVKGKLIASCRA